MNDPAQDERGDPLSSTLKTWKHEPAPARDFNSAVWARIRSAESSATPSLFARLFRFPSASPLAASLAIIGSLTAGSVGAFALNRTVTTDRMAAAYVRSIDPVQMAALHSDHSGDTHP